MSGPEPTVLVVDDDPSVRNALESLIRSVGWQVQTYASAQAFLASDQVDAPGCLVLDVRLPRLSGLDLQHELAEAGSLVPIVFLTGHGDVPMAVQAMKRGAVDFLAKPFREQELLDAIRQALERGRLARRERAELAALRRRHDSLTSRERRVLELVVVGLLNKQVAGQLQLSEATVKAHRAQVMRKMEAESLPALVRMADRLGIPPQRS